VRKAGNRVRITGQLIDASNGAHLWADRFDGDLEDIFTLQDEVSSRVVAVIVPALEQAEIERSAVRPTDSMDAYGYSLRGWACVNELTREGNRKAIEYFTRAVELDPKFALAWAQAAGCYVQRKSWRWNDDPARDAQEAERLCRRALELDRTNPRLLALAGTTLAYVVGLREAGLGLLETATELDPNLSFAWFQLGHARTRMGRPSVAHFERALRLNPRDFRAPFAQTGLALAHIFAGDFAKASQRADEALLQLPKHPGAMLARIAARAHAGEIEEARKTVAAYLDAYPGATIDSVIDRLLPDAYQRVLAQGCRLAGMPE
jgi:tetratricopeptide (TPR) repeat protein